MFRPGNLLKSGMVIGLIFLGARHGFGADPTVKIASFEDKTIVQRANGVGSFAADGSYTGLPAAIQARVVDATGKKEIRTWKNATLISATRKWKATLDGIPQGGFYRIQARYQGQSTSPTQSTNRFGVGMILLMLGQSNMQAFCKDWAPIGKKISPHPLTAYANYGYWHWRSQPTRSTTLIPAVLMVNNLAEALGIPVGLINCSTGSAYINEYVGDIQAYKRDLPDSMKAALEFAGGDVEMILWHQGFSDYFHDGNRSTITPESLKTFVANHGWNEFEQRVAAGKSSHLPYLAKLNRVHAIASQWIKRKNVPMLCGVKGRSLAPNQMENMEIFHSHVNRPPYEWHLARSRQVDCVRWSQMAFAKSHPSGRPLASSIDLRFRDMAHYQLKDMFNLSSRFTQSVLHTLGKASFGGGGPSFVPEWCGFGKGGKGIVLRMKHEGGTRLVLPDPTKPVEGFIVRQPGKEDALAIKKISLQDPEGGYQGVFIELENQPAGDLLVTYLTGQSPISDIKPGGVEMRPPEFESDKAPGNILYDNAKLPDGNSRPGLPVNPTLGCIRISETATIRPARESPIAMKKSFDQSSVYDIFGRRVSTGQRLRGMGIYFNANGRDKQAKRAIILR